VCKPPPNPNFKTTDGIVLLLGKMREREDWHDFAKAKLGMNAIQANWGIPVKYILTPGLLAEAAWEWLIKEKGG
jgi:hypothetical protein